MSSLGAKARYARLGGVSGTQEVPQAQAPGNAMVPTVQDATTARVAAVVDNNKIIEFTNDSDITYTIKANASVPLPVGSILYAKQGGDGQVTFVADAGVTFDPTSDSYSTRAGNSYIAMKHTAMDRWSPMGDLEYLVDATAVVGNPSNADAPPTSIAATADDQRLIRRSGVLAWEADFAVGGGTADAITATITTSDVFTPVDGMLIGVRAASANATTTPTLALNGGTARTITKNGNQALVAGDIKGAGHELLLRYVSAGPRYELLNPAVSGGTFDSLVEGDGIAIDTTDPRNPVISATGGNGLHLDDRVATYASLPGGLGSGDDGFTVWVDADKQAYVWDGAAWPAQYAGISLGKWNVLAVWNKAAGDANTNNIVADVTGYDEVIITFNQVTATASCWRDAQVSVNGGVSYLGGTSYASQDTNGVVTLESALLSHSTSNASARSGLIRISGISTTAPAKPVDTPGRSLPMSMVLTASPITHVRAYPTSGNFSGGSVSIMAR